ncbi:MAG: endolytic transglycosylase MltG [Gammaproteobacteria bacterium]|nr:endolytic transglycosylase MltG [Gammaproteobacteria bacterium]
MLDRWTLLLASFLLAATLVVLVVVAVWFLLRPSALQEPTHANDVFAPVWPGPFTPTRAPASDARVADPALDRAAAEASPRTRGARFRILPGSTVAEVLRRLASDPRVTDDLASIHTGTLMARLGLGTGHAEGRFLPDAYRIGKATHASDILREAHDRMRTGLEHAWRGRASGLPYANPEEALIVAAIIARETARAEDRSLVAAVFARRMHMGMRLQADPTVLYGLRGHFGGTLTRHHLTIDTPYNTYTRDGLPPTPISLPGMPSIEAALHPAASTSLYFVGRGDGTTEFSDTLAEHNAAVRRYRRSSRGRRHGTDRRAPLGLLIASALDSLSGA